jgi:CRP-like cAMP-binding protein
MDPAGRKHEEPTLTLLGSGDSYQPQLRAMLKVSEFFSDLPERDIEILARYVRAYAAEPGTVIFRESESGAFMCLLIEGTAEIFKQDHKFGSRRIGRVEAGKTVGEMALVDGEPRSATCICAQQSRLIMLSREQFVRIIREHPALSVSILLKLLTLMSRRLRLTSGQLVDHLQD